MMLAHGIYFEDLATAVGWLGGTVAGIWSLVRSSRSKRGAMVLACLALLLPLVALDLSTRGRGGGLGALTQFSWSLILPMGLGLLAIPIALIESRAARRDREGQDPPPERTSLKTEIKWGAGAIIVTFVLAIVGFLLFLGPYFSL